MQFSESMPSHFTSLNHFTKIQGPFSIIAVAPSGCPSRTMLQALLPAALRGGDVQRAAAALAGAALTENVVCVMKSLIGQAQGTHITAIIVFEFFGIL